MKNAISMADSLPKRIEKMRKAAAEDCFLAPAVLKDIF